MNFSWFNFDNFISNVESHSRKYIDHVTPAPGCGGHLVRSRWV